MKHLLTVLVGSLALALGPTDAQAQSPTAAAAWAFSDSRTLPPADDPPPFDLVQAANQHCPPPAGGSGAKPPDLENFDKLIAMFQEQLRALAADDPQRATFQASLKALQDARESARAALAAPPPPASVTTPAKLLTFEQALSTVRTTLEAQAGHAAMAALAASPEGKDPRRASSAAVAAVAARNPGGALAALLAAHARAPKDPAHLVNAAAVLNALGRPAEALAFVDKAATLGDYAAPLGMEGRAVLLNNRGHALLALKRFADAEKVLAQAVALEPRLSEAKANLAGALLCQKREQEAVRSFLASAWRAPAKQVVCLDPGGAGVPAAKACGGRSRKSTAEAFDLSAGKPGRLPAIPYPEKAENAGRDLPMFATWKQSLIEQSLGLSKRLADNQKKLNERTSNGGSRRGGAALSRRRFEQAMSFLASTRYEPGVSGLVDVFESTSKALANYPTEIGLNALAANLADRSCGERQSHIKGLHRKWAGLFAAHDNATRALFREEHRLKTGLASNLSGVLHHERATLEIENYTNLTLLGLVGHVEGWILFASRYHDCTEVALGDSPDHPEANNEKAPPCPPFVAGAKFTLKLGEFLTLQVNCEQVEVEAAGPSWLTPFGSVGYKFAPPGTLNHWGRAFDGELTVGAGVKATAGPGMVTKPGDPSPLAPFEVSAKGGAYATFNGDGDCVDLGLIGEVSGAAGGPFGVELGGDAGGIGGPVSLASAFAGP